MFSEGRIIMDEKTARLAEMLCESNNIVFFGGIDGEQYPGFSKFRGDFQQEAECQAHTGTACIAFFLYAIS